MLITLEIVGETKRVKRCDRVTSTHGKFQAGLFLRACLAGVGLSTDQQGATICVNPRPDPQSKSKNIPTNRPKDPRPLRNQGGGHSSDPRKSGQ
jgi:hypothetical protein